MDIQKIIETYGLDRDEVAAQLFPGNKLPGRALDRIIKGESFLDSQQIVKLAIMAGAEIQDLFASSNKNWKATIPANSKEVTFTNGDYKAILDLQTWQTRIYKTGSLKADIILTDSLISIHQFLNKLETYASED